MINKFNEKLKSLLGESRLYFLIYKTVFFIKTLFFIKPKLSKSLYSNLISSVNINDKTKPLVVVPILETNHYTHFHILAMAKAFSLRGYRVLVIVCDEYLPECEIKNIRISSNFNPCFKCNVNRNNLLNTFGLNTINLSSIFSEIEDPVIFGRKVFNECSYDHDSFNRIINDSVTRHYFGAESFYDPEAVSKVREDHTKTAYISLALGKLLIDKYSPSLFFNQMRNYSAWNPLFDLFNMAGIPAITLLFTAFNFNSVRLNDSDLFRHKRTYQRFISNRKNLELSVNENKKLIEFLENRSGGNDNLMKEWNYFKESSVQELKINKNKKNIFLFTNVPWDVGLDEFAGPFNNVIDWVNKTIEHFKDNNEIDIWIKPHPAEVSSTAQSAKSVADFINSKYKILPDNIHLIDPKKGINTYGLFKYIDLGVVLTGTLGLEMAMKKIPVVSAGLSPCYGLGILNEPKSIEQYFNALSEMDFQEAPYFKLSLFCYFYFIHQSFKWPLTKKAFGDNFSGFQLSDPNELRPKNNKDLDIIFNEIECLINDYKKNRALQL